MKLLTVLEADITDIYIRSTSLSSSTTLVDPISMGKRREKKQNVVTPRPLSCVLSD
jgi:hypothetical protein